MGARDLAGLVHVGIDILSTAVSATTKKILANVGSLGVTGGEVAEQDNVEWWQNIGFASRPPKPTKGKAAAQAVVLRRGDYDIAIASQDLRGLELYGKLGDGETCVYAAGEDGNGQARILLKKDGSIAAYTRKGNSPDGAGMLIQLDAQGGAVRVLNDQGFGLIVDADGVKLTAGDAGLTLSKSGAIKLIGKGQTQVDGSTIVLGSVAAPVVSAVLTGATGLVGVASTKVFASTA